MKQVIISILLLTFICAAISDPARPSDESRRNSRYSLNKTDIDENWGHFKGNYSRNYNNSEDSNRRKIFENTLKKINDHNEKYGNGTSSYKMDINRFADMTTEEFVAYVKSSGLAKGRPRYNPSSGRAITSLPASVDWVSKGYVSPIRDQLSCGSCWAFSSVSAIESHYFKTNGKLLSFSEQSLVDCVYATDGCQGGWMPSAFDYVKNNNGIAAQSLYSYVSGTTGKWQGSCKYSSSMEAAQVTGYVAVTDGIADESLVTQALANVGPLSVAIYASSNFQFYSSGVFTDTSCPAGSVNHAVNLVGYGSLNGADYYTLRNSWGTNWGMSGYMYFARDVASNKNQCGVASYASYPLIKQVNTATTTTTVKPSTTTTKVNPTTLTSTVKPSTTTTKVNPTTSTSTVKPTTTRVTVKPLTSANTDKPKTKRRNFQN